MSIWLLPVATGVGAWGGFPAPPKFWRDLVKNSDLFKYFTMFILIWQGGGQQNAGVALSVTIILYIIATLSSWKEDISQLSSNKENFRRFY